MPAMFNSTTRKNFSQELAKRGWRGAHNTISIIHYAFTNISTKSFDIYFGIINYESSINKNTFANIFTRGFTINFGVSWQPFRQLLDYTFVSDFSAIDNAFASLLMRGFATNSRTIDYTTFTNVPTRGPANGFGIINDTSINSSARRPLHLHQNFGVEQSPSTSSEEFLTRADQEGLSRSALDKQST